EMDRRLDELMRGRQFGASQSPRAARDRAAFYDALREQQGSGPKKSVSRLLALAAQTAGLAVLLLLILGLALAFQGQLRDLAPPAVGDLLPPADVVNETVPPPPTVEPAPDPAGTASAVMAVLNPAKVFVLNQEARTLQVIDTDHFTPFKRFIDLGPGVLASEEWFYFIKQGELARLEMDWDRLGMVGRTTLADLPDALSVIGGHPLPVAITPNGKYVVTAHYRSLGPGPAEEATEFWLSVHDAGTGEFLRAIPEEPEHVLTSDAPACLVPQLLPAPDNKTLYEMCLWGNASMPVLRAVHLGRGEFLGQVEIPQARGAALSPNGQQLYVLTREAQVVIVAPSELVVRETISLAAGGGPAAIQGEPRMALDPRGRRLYIGDPQPPSTIYAINVQDWQTGAQHRLSEDFSLHDISVSPDGASLYLLDASLAGQSAHLTRLDAHTLEEQGQLALEDASSLGMSFVTPPRPAPSPVVAEEDASDPNLGTLYYPASLARITKLLWALDEATVRPLVEREGLESEMAQLEALGKGELDVAFLSALGYFVGVERGWVVPGLAEEQNAGWVVPELAQEPQNAGSIAFVARRDSGLVPGEPPEVLAQLAGRRPCYPADWLFPPLEEYILPAGFLVQQGVAPGEPVWMPRGYDGLGTLAGVYGKQCDFAVFNAPTRPATLENFMPSRMSIPMAEWNETMQVLYTLPPGPEGTPPPNVVVFSPHLPPPLRASLTRGVLDEIGFASRAFDPQPYEEFAALVEASGLAVEEYLS
ncbi:MAG: hypothetical protein ACRDIB_18965, partial [Ardenticatenaceae bacterium]